MKTLTIFICICIIASFVYSQETRAESDSLKITKEDIVKAQELTGLEFAEPEIDSMLDELNTNLGFYREMREIEIDNSVPPAILFNPIPSGIEFESGEEPLKLSAPGNDRRPEDFDDLAFYSVRDLAELVRTRQVTSVELTEFALERLKKYDPLLHCVITLTEELALEQAARADAEIAAGKYRGPLHGIPYGAKDLLAVKEYRTTWGAEPYKEQVINYDAAVIRKLQDAGAVLVAKLSLGALAWGDVWFADTTRNPWNLEQGSSGSSAGSAAAVSAGLVPFAIGTETWGSIVSPSTICGATGLRPSFGRVSRTGAMALSWSMDKIGPICRTVEDCAIVFDAILGPDGHDKSVIDVPFNYNHQILSDQVRVGYLKRDFETDTMYYEHNMTALEMMRALGFDLIAIDLPDIPVNPTQIILSAEAAAAFDELTRSGRDDLMVRQIKNAWPNVFRASRFIPAVEYIQANRLREMAIDSMAAIMQDIDVYISPTFEGDNLLLTNLTGHPCVVLPNGFAEDGTPVSITFIGGLFDEATLLAVAKMYQDATGFHLKHPPLFKD
ncbi:MAG TPA: amidase [candidate division Zixibacteria bacterium]|nr:amidase [candidate division Zixibacteria bacterium]HEQ98878.1 amidase [candidate division Zixibacteria bacterium]